MKITMEIVEADLDFLAKTDVRYAELKAGLEHIKNTTKSVKGAFIVESNESVAKSSEAFYASKDYVDASKRLHDINKSGWWQLLNYTGIGAFYVFYLVAFRKGDEGDNRFGSNPKIV